MNKQSATSEFLRANQKTIGIFIFLLLLSGVTSIINPNFIKLGNISDILRYTGIYGLISIGVAFVIITGGIDLSIGSVIGLCAVAFPKMLAAGMNPALAFVIIISIGMVVGLINGLLITGLRLQPFLVTLCGLFVYRGIARVVGGTSSAGFGDTYQGLRDGLVKKLIFNTIPMSFVVLIAVGIVAAVFLNKTVYGRYLLAIGRNEEAARFSGIQVKPMTISVYVISSVLAAFAGIMFVLDSNSATGSTTGNFYELYAIAGAVLGGCSLRGGQGAIVGVILGAALVQVIERSTLFVIGNEEAKYAVIGLFILLGVIVDELLNRYIARRRALEAEAS